LIEGKEIPKTLATSSRGIPRSRASNTFSLRSSEYALMRTLSLRIKEYATRCENRKPNRLTTTVLCDALVY